jgi:putative transposase
LRILTSSEFADLSPNQIVPKLADRGVYVGSEATLHRILREEKLLSHRGRSKPPTRRRPEEHVASGPNQVWSWDISYLPGPIVGTWYYLYLFVDVWSRLVVGWDVFEVEDSTHAAELFVRICTSHGLDPQGLVLHSDNGSPMKGETMLATMQRLGVVSSFSRPRVSDDNPFSESLFRTVKYRPNYPGRFASLEQAREWLTSFVDWYNNHHQHSAIRFVTPSDRHYGREAAILAHRKEVYERACRAHPERWSGTTRNWTPVQTVALNPSARKTVYVNSHQSSLK